MNRVMKGFAATAAVVSFAALTASGALADGRRDLYFQQAMQRYFDQPLTARQLGLAGSAIQTSRDSSNVVGNPAGLGFMQGGEVSGSYNHNTVSGNEHPSYAEIEQKTNQGLVLGAIPIGPVLDGLPDYGNFGMGWSGYQSGEYDDTTQNLHHSGNRIHAAYAKALSDDLSVGYGLTWAYDKLGGENFAFPMENGFRHTVGVQHQLEPATTWGASAFVGHGSHKLTSEDLDDIEKSNILQVGVDWGIAHQLLESTLITFGVDYRYFRSNGDLDSFDVNVPVGGDEAGDIFNARIGIEQEVTDWMTVRGGYRYAGNQRYFFERPELEPLNGSAKYNAWTLGTGIEIPVDTEYVKTVRLDYGVEYRAVGYRDWEHVVSATVPFDVCANRE